METNASFGYWVRRRRKALDLTQDELARRVGCSVILIRKIEADARRPSRQTAERLAEHLSVAPEQRAAFVSAARAALAVDKLAQPAELDPAGGLADAYMPVAGIAELRPAAQPLPRGVITLLFTDIEGSTRLLQRLGDRYAAILADHQRLLRSAFAAWGGHEVATWGDSFFVVFERAVDAVEAAIAAQRALAAHPWPEATLLRVRMALHTGEPTLSAGEYIGLDVHRAARLCAAGHGGQVLLSQTARDMIASALLEGVRLRDLGMHRLKDLQRPERIFQLDIPDLRAHFSPLRSAERPVSKLPAPSTALVGREQEAAAVCALLTHPDVRLLTLSGPGGIGKTRLALQAAANLLGDHGLSGNQGFDDGVFFVALAPIRDPGLVVTAIAQALDVKSVAGQPLAVRLAEHLRDKQALLLLDNFEQVGAAAPFVAELLARCPRLKLLITSRIVLHLYGEHEFVVPPLGLPPQEPPRGYLIKNQEPSSWNTVLGSRFSVLPSPEELAQYEAVRLFVERARAVRPDFALTAASAPAVAEICWRLDGLPLAIELAAARCKLFSPEALLARLAGRSPGASLQLLTGGAHDLPERQQTLRNTIDWSYQLLDAAEQALFRRLAVFVGGFTAEAAEAVCTEGKRQKAKGKTADSESLLPFTFCLLPLESLMDKSMISRLEGLAGEPRFVMRETLREFALEHLEMSAEVEVLQRRHAEYFLDFAERAAPELWGAQQLLWLDRLEADHDNLRAALSWSQGGEGDAEIGLRLAGALWWFWEIHGHESEGRSWLATVLSRAAEPSIARAKALLGAGFLADSQGDYAAARAALEESLAISDAQRDDRGIGRARIVLGLVTALRGDDSGPLALLEAGLALSQALGDTWAIASALYGLGQIANYQGDFARATAFFNQCLLLSRQSGDMSKISLTLSNLGVVALMQGDYAQAAMLLENNLVLCRKLGDKRGIAWTLYYVGTVALDQGDYARARTFYEESLTLRQVVWDRRGIAESLEGFGVLAATQGQAERAARLFGAAAGLWMALGMMRSPANRPRYERTAAAVRAALGDEQLAALGAVGRAMRIEEAISEAMEA
jgi:predicted ATPase/class 3 adenylate cyclase